MSATGSEAIKREVRDGILIGTFNRPEALNAVSSQVLDALADLVADFDREPELRVLVLTGAGRAFVAGADIAEMADMGVREARAFSEKGQELCHILSTLDKLVVAAVIGFALGGGCEIALACDLVYASAKARFSQPEVKLGLMPGFGGTQRLARIVGPRAALELVTTARMLPADEALSLGLVNRVLPAEGFLDGVLEILKGVLSLAPVAVGAAKLAVHRGLDLPLERALALETEMFAGLFGTDDAREGMRAFLDKRDPGFKGQ